MSESRLTYLLHCYFENKATAEETDELMSLLATSSQEEEILAVMDGVWETYEAESPAFTVEKSKSILTGILKTKTLPVLTQSSRRWNWRYAVSAAAVLLLVTFGLYTLINKKKYQKQEIVKTTTEKQDIAPGGNKAVLTLADGSQIVLDSAANGNLTSQGNAKVIKLDNGQLSYTASGTTTEVLYNTVSTPRGGQYNLTLADGSRVWLNAASSLRYPASFSGNERKVELTGEGYFEVAKNASMPFKVNVAGKSEVEVLGTHFNINSYADETTINTTLLEGKVKVTPVTNSQLATQNSELLSPNQQAQQNSTGQIAVKKNTDIDEVMAWKNGKFIFGTATDISVVMRQVARWYNVDVVYEGAVPKQRFGGELLRNSSLVQVLEILKTSGVNYLIDGRKLVIRQ